MRFIILFEPFSILALVFGGAICAMRAKAFFLFGGEIWGCCFAAFFKS